MASADDNNRDGAWDGVPVPVENVLTMTLEDSELRWQMQDNDSQWVIVSNVTNNFQHFNCVRKGDSERVASW